MFDSAKICVIVVELFLLYVNTQIAGRELRVPYDGHFKEIVSIV